MAEGAALSEPMWFFLSFAARPDGAAGERRQPLSHAAGFMEVTSIRMSLPKPAGLSAAAIRAARSPGVSIAEGTDHLLEIGFDHEADGRSHDFRPDLPLVFRW